MVVVDLPSVVLFCRGCGGFAVCCAILSWLWWICGLLRLHEMVAVVVDLWFAVLA